MVASEAGRTSPWKVADQMRRRQKGDRQLVQVERPLDVLLGGRREAGGDRRGYERRRGGVDSIAGMAPAGRFFARFMGSILPEPSASGKRDHRQIAAPDDDCGMRMLLVK